MELVITIIVFLGIVLLLKYFGKSIAMVIAILLTPFYAAYQLIAGKATNRKHAFIIAVCGFVVLLCAVLIGFMGRM